MAFDPNAFLSGQSQPGSFDPIAFLSGKPQTAWEATKEALGGRPELRPYGEGGPVDTSNPIEMARETLSAPVRTGATLNRAFGFPEDVGTAVGYPKTGKAVSFVLPFLVGGGEPRTLPTAGAGREAAVSAADELKIPLSYAERTGNPVAGSAEAMLENTPLGSGPIRDFRKGQFDARQSALDKTAQEMGTTEEPSMVGLKAREGYKENMNTARSNRDAAYSQIPQDVHVPLNNAIKTADQIIQEQSEYLPTTRNGDVVAIAKDIQNAKSGISDGTNVTGGPRKFGETSSVGPQESFQPKPNYPLLSRLRSVLSDKIKQNTITNADGSSTLTQSGRDFARLKSSLDSDIETFASQETTPLDSLTAQEFKRTYGEANANARDFSNTFQNQDVKRLLLTDPEKVVSSVFRKNNVTEVNAFRKAVGEGPFLSAKRQFTQQLLEAKNLGTEMGKYSDEMLKSVYTPEEIGKLQKLANASDLISKSQSQFANPSGTGRQVIGAGSWGAAGYALKAGHPEVALTILGLPYLASKGLVSASRGIPNQASRVGIGVGSLFSHNIDEYQKAQQ